MKTIEKEGKKIVIIDKLETIYIVASDNKKAIVSVSNNDSKLLIESKTSLKN